jgi:hypothetical protein
MADQLKSDRISEGAADQALRRHDWLTAELFVWQVLEDDPDKGKAWLERFAAEARRVAASGDAGAEFAVGNSELLRWQHGLAAAESCLRSALHSFMRAAEAAHNVTVTHQVHYWYGLAREEGYSFSEVETFIENHPVP